MSQGIVWSSVTRDTVILAEAGEDDGTGKVISLAQKMMKQKPTAGWEFKRSKGFRGIKFHVYDHAEDRLDCSSQGDNSRTLWIFSCIAESSLEESQQKSFLEKLVYLTEPLRHDDYLWREGDLLACQATFGPMLQQRMEQVGYQGKLAMVNQSLNTTKEIMAKNIDMLMDRGETLEELDDRAIELNAMSKQFRKRADQVKKFEMWQNAKHGVMIGTAVTAGVAIVTVPPLIALL